MRILTLIVFCMALSACGVKPGQVSAPEGAEDVRFPQAYPNPDTDPKP